MSVSGIRIVLLLSLAAVVTIPVQSQQGRQCRGNPKLIGQCFKVHGRVRIGNGGPQMRIWHIGTDRVLGVLPSEDEIIPVNLENAFKHDLYVDVFGDFEVCPFTEQRDGEMQMVCVESARNLVTRKSSN
jgi:hypothetical protein